MPYVWNIINEHEHEHEYEHEDLTADFQDFLDIIPFFHGIPQVLVQNGIKHEAFQAFHGCMVSCLVYGDISPTVSHGLECLKYIYLLIHNKI